jgi:FixJ family two-component response regulator
MREWTKALIAIVDDDESVRLALQSLIRSFGLVARVFDPGVDFLASVNMFCVRCPILDMNMPVMSGLALLRQLVASGQTIPTLLITADANDAMCAEAIRHGALCYLTKPFTDDDLLAWINVALGQAGPTRAKPS